MKSKLSRDFAAAGVTAMSAAMGRKKTSPQLQPKEAK